MVCRQLWIILDVIKTEVNHNVLPLVRKPLCGKGGPFKSCAKDHIIEEWRIFLPCFILYRSLALSLLWIANKYLH